VHYLDDVFRNTRGIPRALEVRRRGMNDTYIDYEGNTHCPAIYERKFQTKKIRLISVPLTTRTQII